MHTSQIAECDYGDPQSVVRAFIESMNSWEKFAHQLSREAEQCENWPEILRTQELVFSRFCTAKDRPSGRSGSFQNPPEYDPRSEIVVSSNIERKDRAHVETDRVASLGGGRYRYTLHLHDGRWLIDNVKFDENGRWRPSIL